MDQKSRENFIKIKEFLEDIYMYLNNTTTIPKSHSSTADSDWKEEDECQRHDEKRRELIENCKHIRSIFENEFHPHDVDSTISYLDMNGAANSRIKNCISDVNEIDPSKEEYVDMRQRKSSNNGRLSENPYNIYEAAISLNKQDSEKCPFTGLPAVHLKLMCSPIAGLLTRIERKLFFGQSKDFYAGILDKWILLYPSKSNDMAPSEYFYPKSLEISKGENQFIIVTSHDKRYQFQAPNSQEYDEWIDNINKILEEIESGRIKESRLPQLLLSRKLPSLPTASDNGKKEADDIENYYSFGGTQPSINSNEERLYEEPCSASIESESPPKLPKKIGKKIIEEEEDEHEYDTPKSTKSVKELSDIKEEENNLTEVVQDIEHNENVLPTNVPRGKVSEIIPILSGINLISPEEKLRSSNAIRTRKSQNMDDTVPSETVENYKRRKSPVKKWFRQTIMRGKRFSQKEKSPSIEEHDEEMNKVVKGSKVNMIINQLEKTGQLKTLKKGLKSRKSLTYDTGEEYETVCVKSQLDVPKMKIMA